MKDNVLQSLKSIKKLIEGYVFTLGILELSSFIVWLNKGAAEDGRGSFEIFDLTIYPEYFSLIVGILVGAFILVLFLEMRLLRTEVDRISHGEIDNTTDLVDSIEYFPWTSSPFHPAEVGVYVFWGIIFIGLALAVGVAISHILGKPLPPEDIMEAWMFRAIGYVVAVIVVICAFLIWFIAKDASCIKAALDSLRRRLAPPPNVPSDK